MALNVNRISFIIKSKNFFKELLGDKPDYVWIQIRKNFPRVLKNPFFKAAQNVHGQQRIITLQQKKNRKI